ncbi:MAG: aminoacyl-tRNA hydrolase [Candidatus Taylorbacteria bacterium]
MSYIIVGLGNPGEEYENTRHNVGRMALMSFQKEQDFPEWKLNSKINALISEKNLPNIGKVTLILPEAFMNNSGKSLTTVITSKKKAKELVVVHDDLDLPQGKVKISFNKSAGGHRGVQNIVNKIKTEEFVRVRIGISPETKKGIKKPQGEKAVLDFILGKLKPEEEKQFKKEFKTISKALLILLGEGWSKAASVYGSL